MFSMESVTASKNSWNSFRCCGAGGQEFVVPGLAIAADERLLQEFHKAHLLISAAFSAPRTFFDFNVPEKLAPSHWVNADREQVAGDRLAPGDLPLLPGTL